MAVQPLNFAEMFMNAMEVKRRRQESKLSEQKFKFDQDQAKAEAQARQDEIFRKQKEARAERTANIQRQAAQMIQSNPANTERVVGMLRGMMDRGEIDPIEQIAPPQQPQMAGDAAPQAAGSAMAQAIQDAQRGVAPQQEQFNPQQLAESLSLESAARLGASPQAKQEQLVNSLREFSQLNPQMQPGSPEFRDAFTKWDAQRSRNRRPVTNVNANITNATKTMAEGMASDAMQELDKFSTIRELATDPETGMQDYRQFLTLGAKMQRRGANLLDAVNMSPSLLGISKQEHQKMQKFAALVQGYRAKKFKDFLGSAQSKQEIANLADSVISMDQSPEEFEAALDQLEGLAQSQLRHAQRLLDDGITQSDPRFAKRLDEEYFADKAEAALAEYDRILKRPGMTEQRAWELAGLNDKWMSAWETREARRKKGGR